MRLWQQGVMSIAVDWYITDIGYKRSIILEEGFKSLKQVVGGNLGNKGKTSGRTAEPWQKIRTNKKENRVITLLVNY